MTISTSNAPADAQQQRADISTAATEPPSPAPPPAPPASPRAATAELPRTVWSRFIILMLCLAVVTTTVPPLLAAAAALALAGSFAWEYIWVEAGQSVPLS